MTFTQKVPCSPFRERELYKLILDVSPKIDVLPYHEMTVSILSWVLYLSLDSSLLRCTWAVCYSKKDFGLGGSHPGSTLKSRNPGVPVLLGWCLPFPIKYWFLKKSQGFFPDTVAWEQKCCLGERSKKQLVSSFLSLPGLWWDWECWQSSEPSWQRRKVRKREVHGQETWSLLTSLRRIKRVCLVGRAHLTTASQHFSSLQRKVIWRDSCKSATT